MAIKKETLENLKAVALVGGACVVYAGLCYGCYKLLGKAVAIEVAKQLPRFL